LYGHRGQLEVYSQKYLEALAKMLSLPGQFNALCVKMNMNQTWILSLRTPHTGVVYIPVNFDWLSKARKQECVVRISRPGKGVVMGA